MTRCIKCKKQEATKEDGLCNSCRFMATLDSMIKDREEEEATIVTFSVKRETSKK